MAITDRNTGDVLTEAAYQSIIDTVENTTTGHDHDGTDSKKVDIANITGGAVQIMVCKFLTGGSVSENIKTFSAGTFAATDILEIKMYLTKATGSSAFNIKINDVTTPVGFNVSASTSSTAIKTEGLLWQDQTTNDVGRYSGWWSMTDDTFGSDILATADTNDANWMTTQWTLTVEAGTNLGSDSLIIVKRIPQVT